MGASVADDVPVHVRQTQIPAPVTEGQIDVAQPHEVDRTRHPAIGLHARLSRRLTWGTVTSRVRSIVEHRLRLRVGRRLCRG